MKRKKIVYILLVLLCMLIIFTFSSKNSTSSNSTSKGLINNILNVYEKITDNNIDKAKLIDTFNYPVRKLAHYSIYFFLGIFVYELMLLTKVKHKKIFAVIICFIYASFDEVHQLFVIGRTGQVRDVFIDTLGSISAIFLIGLMKTRKNREGDFYMIKDIIKQVMIGLFFTAFMIVIVHFTLGEKIDFALSLINKVVVESRTSTKKEIKFDPVKKRLIEYPEYGTIYATLKIPDLGLELPVYHGDTLDIIKYGVGHFSGSYFPGEGGSIILAAHNSLEHFKRLPEVKIGSNISIETSYGTFTYQVTNTKIINDKDEASLPIQDKEEILMMYTCYPMTIYGYKTERYVVYSKLVGEER